MAKKSLEFACSFYKYTTNVILVEVILKHVPILNLIAIVLQKTILHKLKESKLEINFVWNVGEKWRTQKKRNA